MGKNYSIDSRLMTAKKFVRKGSYLSDVGTDHALLPIFLYKENIIVGAVASDVAEGPCESARQNVKENGLERAIKVVKTNGLFGIEEYHPEDITIFGMGGELIVEILKNAPFIKSKSIRLILQPMTHAEILVEYLMKNGFTILDEEISKENGKIYRTICAEYDEIKREATIEEKYLGVAKKNELYFEYIEKLEKTVKKVLDGKKKGSTDTSLEETIINTVEKIKEKRK